MTRLSDVPYKTPFVVKSIDGGETGIRLIEMGIVPEAKIEVLFSAPSGCPLAVSVNQEFVLGLRKEEANLVTVYFTT